MEEKESITYLLLNLIHINVQEIIEYEQARIDKKSKGLDISYEEGASNSSFHHRRYIGDRVQRSFGYKIRQIIDSITLETINRVCCDGVDFKVIEQSFVNDVLKVLELDNEEEIGKMFKNRVK